MIQFKTFGRWGVGGMLALGALWVLLPLISPLCLGALLAAWVYPLFQNLRDRWRGKAMEAALCITTLLSGLVLLPLAFFILSGIQTALRFLQDLSLDDWDLDPLSQSASSEVGKNFWTEILGDRFSLSSKLHAFQNFLEESSASWLPWIKEGLGNLISFLTEWLGGSLAHLPMLGLHFLIVVGSVVFFLVNASKILYWIRHLSFFSEIETEDLLVRLLAVSRAVLLAALVSGSLQTLLALGFAGFLGFPHWLWMGGLVFFSSFIPAIGALPVNLGFFCHQWLLGNRWAAWILLIHAVLNFILDTLIRPLVLKKHTNLSPFLAILGALGGLQAFGLLGLFVGPIFLSLALAFFTMFSCSDRSDHYQGGF